ncbi:MAG TPA: hypothetical protein VGJ06_13615 [Candidatus Acidoferrum sp.]
MNREEQDLNDLNQLKHLLRQAMPPLPLDQLEPRTDLWPQLRARIESQRPNAERASTRTDRATSRLRVPWFDYALAALAAAALIFFPGIIPALLYHF